MNARKKLNWAYVNGTLVIAGTLGVVTGSWLVFLAPAGVLTVVNLASGAIRPNGRGRGGR
jgi:hypothetical protein